MWARVSPSNEILEIIRHAKAITIDGLQHPKSIFTLWSDAEKAEIGIYPVQDAPHPDSRFYTWGSPTSTFNTVTKVVEISYSSTEKSLDDTLWTAQEEIKEKQPDGSIVTKVIDVKIPDNKSVGDVRTQGLKNAQITRSKHTANSLLSPTDWYVTRSTERSKAIPSDVSTYRAAVISTLDTMETKIKAVSTLSAFKELHEYEYYANGVVKTTSVIHTWPDPLED